MEKVSWRRRRDDDDDDASSWKRIKRRGGVIEISNDDMLEEIMVRLPVKSLVRFQIVSKHWRGMITSSSFREKYMLHQKTQEPKFVSFYQDNKCYCCHNLAAKTLRMECACLVGEEEYHIRDDSEEKLVVISNSLDGLVCFYGFMDLTKPIKVVNPATRWSHTLPLAKIQRCCSDNKKNKLDFPSPGFGKDYVTGAYKLVWLHNINDYTTTSSSSSSCCELFDFGVKQWRQVSPPAPRPGPLIKEDREPVFANGWLYWFCQEKTELVAFDLHMEMFQVVPNPSSPSSVEMDLGSIDDDRRLMWISEISKDGMQQDIWRLTNHNTGGALLKMGKMFSFALDKISCIEPLPHPSSHLRLEAVSKKGNKAILAIPFSHCLFLFQHPNHLTSISYSSPRPINSVIRPYFPSFASLL